MKLFKFKTVALVLFVSMMAFFSQSTLAKTQDPLVGPGCEIEGPNQGVYIRSQYDPYYDEDGNLHSVLYHYYLEIDPCGNQSVVAYRA